MEYLFFDIECCNGRDICEFGYVVTDENFRVLEKDDLVINPKKPFELNKKGKRPDIRLYYPEERYAAAEEFPAFYGQIRALIEKEGRKIFGYSISNDARFLRTATKRYGLEPIVFRFYDSQNLYEEYVRVGAKSSLENACAAMKVTDLQNLHKSDDDAESTVKLVQAMCRDLDVTAEELIALFPSCAGACEEDEIYYDCPISNSMYEKTQYGDFRKFVGYVAGRTEPKPSVFTGKKVTVSFLYEKWHFYEMLAITKRLSLLGGEYVFGVGEADIFITDERDCTDLSLIRFGERKVGVGDRERTLTVMSRDDFLRALGITEEELETKLAEEAKDYITDMEDTIRGEMRQTSTLAAVFASKGIDLSALFAEEETPQS